MSSTFIKSNTSRKTGKAGFGTSQRGDVYLQFVPGQVTDVATSQQSKAWQNDNHQNSIIAKSHIKDNQTAYRTFGSDKRYFPLMRGMVDVPAVGDPVLLCSFAGQNFYLGPLNTQNSPNHNTDPFGLIDSIPTINGKIVGSKSQQYDANGNPIEGFFDQSGKFTKKSIAENKGESPNFIKSDYKRLQKPYVEKLDNPRNDKPAYRDIHGDMMIEGRHGNSIRLGSRDQNPIFMISNGRSKFNKFESLNDNTILSMTTKGSIWDHFQFDGELDDSSGESKVVEKKFVLASNSKEGNTRFIDSNIYNYEYDNPQLFLSSDKITINSKKQSMFLSSFDNIIFGSANSIELISENSTTIETSNFFIGKKAKQKFDDGSEVENLVLGNQLKLFLTEVLEVLQTAHGLCQGAPLPLVDSTNKPLASQWASLIRKLKKPEFLSNNHFIESNEEEQQ